MEIRPYKGLHDLHAMLDLLSDGRKADNGTYYVHHGDLQWWLFYTDVPQETWQSNIRLWFQEDCLIGWALLSPDEQAFDVYAVPQLRGSLLEAEMFAWAVERMSTLDRLQTLWVAENDEVRIRWLEENGFVLQHEHFVRFQRSLSGALEAPPLPDGFRLRTSRGEEDARLRSACSHAAFGSSKPFEEYWPRTLRFMQSPVYLAEHELFVVAPSGNIAAYCIVWTDELNKIGHFEPVGTHPDYQRKGLGRALLFEAFHRLRDEGMTEACVCTNNENLPALHLYESAGFQRVKRLLTYVKRN